MGDFERLHLVVVVELGITLVEPLAVYEGVSVADCHGIAGHADYALDEVACRVVGEVEDDDFAVLGRVEREYEAVFREFAALDRALSAATDIEVTVHDLVDEEILALRKRRAHAGAFDLVCLHCELNADEQQQ